MSDERVTDRPDPPPPGFRPPSPRPSRFTAYEWLQVWVSVALLGLLGGVVGIVYSGVWPGLLFPLACAGGGAVLGGLLCWRHISGQRVQGTRVAGRGLPAGPGEPAKPRPPRPDLPPAGIMAGLKGHNFAPAPGLLRVAELGDHPRAVSGVAISPNLDVAVTCGEEGLVVARDLASGFELWADPCFGHKALAVAFSPDGKLVAASGVDGTLHLNDLPPAVVHVLDARTGRALRRIDFRDVPHALAWLPDSRYLLVGCVNRVRLIEINEPAEVSVFEITGGILLPSEVYCLATDPAGRVVVAGTSVTRDARVLTLPEGVEALRFAGHAAGRTWLRNSSVRAAAVSIDRERAITGGNDGTARVWAVRSGEELACFKGHAGWWGWHGVTGVAWLPGGLALSSGEDGTLRLWHPGTGEELNRWVHGRGIRCLAVSADGKVAITGAWDGSVRVWHIG